MMAEALRLFFHQNISNRAVKVLRRGEGWGRDEKLRGICAKETNAS